MHANEHATLREIEARDIHRKLDRLADRPGEQAHALAALDRLTHHREIIEAGNESWRFKNRA